MHSKSVLMQDYCNDFALKNNVNIFNANINSKKEFNNQNIESKARDYRYKELKNICLENDIQYILTGHHEDDQIETIYMCQKNNSSWISRIGIREKLNLFKNDKYSINVLRPMLSINKKYIIEYAKKNQLSFYDDPTNFDSKFLRNKVRLELNLKMNKLSFRNSILKVSKLNNKRFLKIKTKIISKKQKILFFSKRGEIVILNKENLLKQDFDFFLLFFKEILNKEFSYIYKVSTSSWKNLFKFILSNKIGKIFEGQNNSSINMCSSKKHIYIYKETQKESLNIKVNSLGNYKTQLGTVSVMPCNKFTEYKSKDGFCVPYEYIDDLKMENWKHGDKCTSNNSLSSKVSDIFINNKLSLFEKKNYPIIKYKNTIIWIPNLFHGKVNMNSNYRFINLKWNSLL